MSPELIDNALLVHCLNNRLAVIRHHLLKTRNTPWYTTNAIIPMTIDLARLIP